MTRRLLRSIRRRIAVKLTLTLVGFTVLTMLVAGLYLGRALEGFAIEALESRLATAARLLVEEARPLLGEGVTPDQVRAFATRTARPTEARVSLIAADGRVLGDSDVPVEELHRVENHAGRPEVRGALAGRISRDVRRSATVGTSLLYVAVPIGADGRVKRVLRLALPLTAVIASYETINRVLLAGGLVALVVATGIGVFIAGRVTRPVVEMQAIARQMSEGQFGLRAPTRSVDEIGALGRALNVMAGRLREKINDLEQEQARATAVLNGMIEGVIAVDERETVLLMNERARAMLGLARTRDERRPFQEVIRNADLHEIFRQGRAAGGGVVRRELHLAHPVARTLEANAVPLRLGVEERGVVIVLHDVTALRRLERIRTEFVANVSHELRTPLTAIQGYLETLLGGALEDREHARPFLETAFRHTQRLGRLLNDLTDLSNIELGKVTLRREPTRLEEIVDSALAIIQPRAESGRVTLETALPDDLPEVDADRDRLAQILINLVDNAVKYTPAAGRVRVGARAVGADMVEVEVADTGVGIPRADLPRITERFYRVDKARSRELGGTGLGLAIVKHLVIAHGGELTIDSEPGQGTTVRFSLPTAAARPAPLPAASA
jgi:two-component system phosphate regulon sensor histidine kinase PhoR